MTHLLDTDTCIYWLNGVEPVRKQLEAVGMGNVAISVITAAELYFGAYNSARVAENLARAETFVKQMTALPLSDTALKVFGQLKADLRRQGRPVADFDLLIASTALAENRILVTNNTRHYQRIPELQLENWTTARTS